MLSSYVSGLRLTNILLILLLFLMINRLRIILSVLNLITIK